MKHRRPALVPLPPPREDDAPYLAFAWFREEEYADFKALLAERDWHDTFAEWDKDIERHVWLARVGGVGVVRATVGGRYCGMVPGKRSARRVIFAVEIRISAWRTAGLMSTCGTVLSA
ncbi:hypothetical protein [Stenotrophomonas sp. SPM]|uniref:hypothetical protein n=1 Tax=Stenotrophomonas sp. SPM TaxID=2170735 RepID=UPI001058197C|nr:hypothetical protein [Stenotrophomonas sp. SPM]